MPNSMFQIIVPGDNPNQGKDKINYNFSILSANTGGSGLVIGGQILSGTPTEVLYTDSGGNLISDEGFTRVETNGVTGGSTTILSLPSAGITTGVFTGLIPQVSLSGNGYAGLLSSNVNTNIKNIMIVGDTRSVGFNVDTTALGSVDTSLSLFSGVLTGKDNTSGMYTTLLNFNSSLNSNLVLDNSGVYISRNGSGGTKAFNIQPGGIGYKPSSGSQIWFPIQDGNSSDVLTTDGNGQWSMKNISTDGGFTSNTVTTAYTLNVSLFRTANINLTNGKNTNIILTNFSGGNSGNIILKQGTSGNSTVTFSGVGYSNLVVNGGLGKINLTQIPNAIDIISYLSDGTNIYWSTGYNYS